MVTRRSSCSATLLAFLFVAGCDATQPLTPDAGEPLLGRASTAPSGITLGAPVFGLDATHDGLLAAVASAGVFRVRGGSAELMVALPGVSDVVAAGGGTAYAITGGAEGMEPPPSSRKLYRIARGQARVVADLWEFEQRVNPDGFWHTGAGTLESNPFDVERLDDGRLLVADAAGNSILVVRPNGRVDWVAVLTPRAAGAPQPVPTSVVVGPDGGYYVGELTGFPGTPGLSRIWRIAPGRRHVVCPSRACRMVADGFTSIIDLAFGRDGSLYVVELDEAGWFAMEQNGFAKTAAGGTINRCRLNGRNGDDDSDSDSEDDSDGRDAGSVSCSVVAAGLSLPTAIAIDRRGGIWVVEHQPVLFAAARVSRVR